MNTESGHFRLSSSVNKFQYEAIPMSSKAKLYNWISKDLGAEEPTSRIYATEDALGIRSKLVV